MIFSVFVIYFFSLFVNHYPSIVFMYNVKLPYDSYIFAFSEFLKQTMLLLNGKLNNLKVLLISV